MGVVLRDDVFANGGPGIEVAPDALVAVSQISTSSNVGPGIDIVPSGVTPNPKLKKGNLDLDWPEQLVWDDDRLTGLAVPFSRVELYTAEPLPRTGNPLNGEGHFYLNSAVADAAGRFAIPISCIPGLVLTTTATVPADEPPNGPMARTSEFSENVTCKPITITSLQLDEPADLVVGTDRGTALLNTVATDSAGNTRNVTTDPAIVYASSNPAVIEISNAPASKGVITAKTAGEATLTAQIPASLASRRSPRRRSSRAAAIRW